MSFVSCHPPSPAFQLQGSTKRYRSSSFPDLLDRVSISWIRAGSLPPFSPDSVSGYMETAIAPHWYTQTLNALINYFETFRPHLPRFSWQHSSALAWRRPRWFATGKAFLTSRRWMPRVLSSWKISLRPHAFLVGSVTNCAPFSLFNPPFTECHQDVPLPLSGGLNFQTPWHIFALQRRQEMKIEPLPNGGMPSS